MTIDTIKVEETLKNAVKLIAEDKGLSSATKSLLEILVLIITLLAHRLNLNSKNSSKPPSTDPNREKTGKKNKSNKAGGQVSEERDSEIVMRVKLLRRSRPQTKGRLSMSIARVYLLENTQKLGMKFDTSLILKFRE